MMKHILVTIFVLFVIDSGIVSFLGIYIFNYLKIGLVTDVLSSLGTLPGGCDGVIISGVLMNTDVTFADEHLQKTGQECVLR